MSVESPSPSSPPPRRRRRGLFGIGLAALALGALSGAGVLYVMETRSGNEAMSAAACGEDEAARAALDAGARGEVAAVQPLDTPFDASSLAFKDGDGKPATLSGFAGQTLLVNLWATWCLPCRAEMPALDTLERERGDEAFAVVPINVDLGEAEKPKAFYTETGLTSLPFYRDETMGVFNDLKARGLALGLPVTLLVDPAGCARGILSGPAEWASPDALKLIDGLKGLGGTTG
ncbi:MULTISPECIES: thiol:disulfide interchange protein TlpA [unclassified Aureimonas]|uniref:thiol:disulfide interchange protein TlpA n=1 Tax=unclassified Aureimonas TaxID=2615206 RepID=UPI0006FDBFC3|nr:MULTISPECIES: TlpA disulfide reductase family protein [unclassified Aureimonas]KQT53961.1 sodium:dicarboxylate symporter [Aureimonas sp. Leaf427]KQT71599.1 sodium:dicarboxylate symporter [Aureimonas sp. Leaf460]